MASRKSAPISRRFDSRTLAPTGPDSVAKNLDLLKLGTNNLPATFLDVFGRCPWRESDVEQEPGRNRLGVGHINVIVPVAERRSNACSIPLLTNMTVPSTATSDSPGFRECLAGSDAMGAGRLLSR